MSTRLQVLLDDSEMREIKRIARRNQMTVAEWVRQALRVARRAEAKKPAEGKLKVVREAARHEYPTANIDQMLKEIEGGYLGDDA